MKITFKNQSNYIRKFLLKEFQKTFDNTNREILYYKDAILEIEQCLLNEHCEKAILKINFYKEQIKELDKLNSFLRLHIAIFEKDDEIKIILSRISQKDILKWLESFLDNLIEWSRQYRKNLESLDIGYENDIYVQNEELRNELIDIICDQIITKE